MFEIEVIVVFYGVGLINIVFCNFGIKVVEFFLFYVKFYYWFFCNCCNFEYYSYYDFSYNFFIKDEMSLVDLVKSC